MRIFIRVLIAIIGGTVLGNLIAIFASFGIDASYGGTVTAGKWALSLPNIVYAILIGFFVGFFAGFIAKNKGWLIGAAAIVLPYVIIGLYLNSKDGAMAYLNSKYVSNPLIWPLIELLPSMAGGYIGVAAVNDIELVSILKRIGWHWCWLWIPSLIFISFLAGSVRFLLNMFTLGWQIIFNPRLWLIGCFAWGFIASLLFLAYSVPVSGYGYLLMTLGSDEMIESGMKARRIISIFLVIIGIPLLLSLVWFINGLILNFFAQNGLRIY